MSTEALLQEIQSHSLRLQQAEADARYWYEHYLDELQARYQQQLQEIGAGLLGPGGASQLENRGRCDGDAPHPMNRAVVAHSFPSCYRSL